MVDHDGLDAGDLGGGHGNEFGGYLSFQAFFTWSWPISFEIQIILSQEERSTAARATHASLVLEAAASLERRRRFRIRSFIITLQFTHQ